MIESWYQESKFRGKYRIESLRLKGWDYGANGYYFITICVKNGECVFGKIIDGKMVLTEIGNIAETCWRQIPEHFPFVKPDEFVIMPNHVHGIIFIDKAENANPKNPVEAQDIAPHQNQNLFGPQSRNLASIVRGFKVGVTKWAKKNHIEFQWQSGFYDHIIKNEKSLSEIRKYIQNNVINWNNDKGVNNMNDVNPANPVETQYLASLQQYTNPQNPQIPLTKISRTIRN